MDKYFIGLLGWCGIIYKKKDVHSCVDAPHTSIYIYIHNPVLNYTAIVQTTLRMVLHSTSQATGLNFTPWRDPDKSCPSCLHGRLIKKL